MPGPYTKASRSGHALGEVLPCGPCPGSALSRETLGQTHQPHPDAVVRYLRIGAEEPHGGESLQKVELNGRRTCVGPGAAALWARKKERDRHVERLRDPIQPRRGDAVPASFVLLNLLKSDAQHPADLGRAQSALQSQGPQALCDFRISWIAAALSHFRFPDEIVKRERALAATPSHIAALAA